MYTSADCIYGLNSNACVDFFARCNKGHEKFMSEFCVQVSRITQFLSFNDIFPVPVVVVVVVRDCT